MQLTAGEPLRGVQMREWNNPRCGSLFTAKIDGTSMYGIIKRFLRIRCRYMFRYTEVAYVQWFPAPEYPNNDPLLVRIDMDADDPKILQFRFFMALK